MSQQAKSSMKEIYRILDANFNRVREALRVAEDCGRFALNDPAITAMAKNLRSDLKEILTAMPVSEFISSRDTPGDIGTEISSPTEPKRDGLSDVVTAACKRLTEALRTIEEYSKFIAPAQTIRIERMRYDAYTLEQRLHSRLLIGRRWAAVRLYALITRKLCSGSMRETARAAIAGGADAIQLREKDASDAELLAIAAELRELTDEVGKLLIVNDRPDIAAIVGADGVHLGQRDLPMAEARRLLRPGAIIGRSTHEINQAKAAVNEGADYIAVGPMFETTTKDVWPIAGPILLKQALDEIPLPIVAIGGINAQNVSQITASGAKCVAVSSAICGAKDPKAAAKAIRQQLPD
ncbi:MAG: thiamine phosphate synthase [Planctomycetes bacterium]|nr:thiamine phosphate synthase [Planctomycetota bacterium]